MATTLPKSPLPDSNPQHEVRERPSNHNSKSNSDYGMSTGGAESYLKSQMHEKRGHSTDTVKSIHHRMKADKTSTRC